MRMALLAAASFLLSSASPTKALDLKSGAGQRSSTFAYGKELKRWDNIKQYGAQTVGARERTSLQPDDIRIGNYIISPSIETRYVFNDNIFATAGDRIADQNLQLLPKIKFSSRFARHTMDFEVGGSINRYVKHTELNYNDVYGSFDGALHINNAHTLSVSLLSAYEHEDPLAEYAPLGAIELTPIWHNKANIGLTRDAGRMHATISATYEAWDFGDVKARNGSTINQDARDLKVFSSDIKLGYRFSPGYSFETRIRGMRRLHRGDTTFDSDAWGYEIISGLKLETNPLLKWQFLAGYGVRDYDAKNLQNNNITLIQGRVTWLPTQRLTINGIIRRAFDDGISENEEKGTINNSAQISAAYEASRNLIFTISGKYMESEFMSSLRRDRLRIGNFKIEYLHSKNWRFTLDYEHSQRTSNVAERDTTRNKLMFGAKLRF